MEQFYTPGPGGPTGDQLNPGLQRVLLGNAEDVLTKMSQAITHMKIIRI